MNAVIRFMFVTVLCLMAVDSPARAQNRDSFEEFRQGIKSDFQSFRKTILEDYDKYLDGIWKEYQAFRGVERNPLPKPRRPEVVGPDDVPQGGGLPTPSEPNVPVVSQVPQDEPAVPNHYPDHPEPFQVSFDFYGITGKAPEMGFERDLMQLRDLKFSDLWRMYSNRNIAGFIVPAMQRAKAEYTLNDWLLFEFVRCYVNGVFADADADVRISLIHYLLAHLGFDVRIGNVLGQPCLLVAIAQQVYGRVFAQIDGQKYYFFYDSSAGESQREGTFSTYDIPEDADRGRAMDLVIHEPLTIPYIPRPYKFCYGGLIISGEMNAALAPMLYHYPQMPIGCYALSNVDGSLRENVSAQIRRQLVNVPRHQAVDRLLQFVQSAFDYATDDEQHGFEKPYFFEEMLFYPQCDCEDRSIFYSFLLENALAVDNMVIGFPNHEAVAVHLDEQFNGRWYNYGDKKFYISDPTYIGAVTGQCMPEYRSVRPEIDFFAR